METDELGEQIEYGDVSDLELEAIGAHADRVEDAIFSSQEDFLTKMTARGWSRKDALDEWLRIDATYPNKGKLRHMRRRGEIPE